MVGGRGVAVEVRKAQKRDKGATIERHKGDKKRPKMGLKA